MLILCGIYFQIDCIYIFVTYTVGILTSLSIIVYFDEMLSKQRAVYIIQASTANRAYYGFKTYIK